MASINVLYKFSLDTNPSVVVGDGKTVVAVPITLGTVAHAENVVVADNYTTVTPWITGGGGLTTFQWGILVSNRDVWIELRNDHTGGVEYEMMEVKANVPAFIPGKMGVGTGAEFDGAVLVDNTDFADVDRIRVYNNTPDATGDASVDLFLFA